MKHWVCKRAPGHAERGARVPRRQRLRGGVRHAAAPARLAAQLDLGGLGQRLRARRAARAREGARGAAGVPGRVRAGARRQRRARRPARPPRGARCRRTRSSRPAAWSSDLALALQASLLVRNAPAAVADAFCAVRLGGDGGRAYGTLPAGVDTEAIVDRALARLNTLTLRGHGPRSPASRSTGPSAATGSRSTMPRELAECVERGEPRPGGPRDRAGRQRQGLLRRLRPRRVRRDAGAEPRPGRALGPGRRLADDEPQPARLHEPVPLGQAGGLQGARLLRGRRHRHGAVLGPARDRRRRAHRLPARARLGRADLGAVGVPRRRPARQAAALHRRPDRRPHRARVGPGDRGAAGRRARRALRGAGRADRAHAR